MGIDITYHTFVGAEIPEEVFDEKWQQEEDPDRLINWQPEQPCYVIYSSMGGGPTFVGMNLFDPKYKWRGDSEDEYEALDIRHLNLEWMAHLVKQFAKAEFDLEVEPKLISFVEYS